MKLLCPGFIAFLTFVAVAAAPVRAATPFISEIVPDNARTLADEDGSFPDWIEIHNPGPGAVNLQGWFLTDTPLVLSNWAFPSVNLSAGGYLVVFASGKNRTNDPARLHTSFQLETSGEYLALIQPDGATIASEFSPAFPAVKEDVSFGVAQSLVVTSFLAGSAPLVLVPTNAASLPADWNLTGFSPGSEWSNGVAPPAVGYDTNLAAGNPVNVAPGGTASQSTVNGSFTPNLGINNNYGDFTHTLSTDPAPFWELRLSNSMPVFSVVLFNRTSCCGSRLRDITIQLLATNAGQLTTNFSSTLLNPENAGFAFPNGPAYLSNNLVALTGGPVFAQVLRVRRTPDPDLSGTGGQGNADEAAVLSLGEVVVNAVTTAGLKAFVRTDVESLMLGRNASAFLRVPFTSTNTPETLTLKARYDDGFIAYLNGVEIVRRNAPLPAAWDSAATADRDFASASTQEMIDVSSSIPLLANGANLFAVQLLNASAGNGDALFEAELLGVRVQTTSNVFFTDTTPGAANTTPWYYDEVADTHFTVDRGFFTNAFTVEITNATPGSQIYCSFNSDEPGPTKGFLYTGPITISNTTVLRTRAFRENWKPTDVDTATYIFIADVIRQGSNWTSTASPPPPYFPATWGNNAVNYGMDPEVVTNFTLAQWYEAFTQIPSISIVTEMPNLFDAATGIYANALQQGELWERPASIELIDPGKAVPSQFQENCGLRIRGGFSRNLQFPRHAFRIFFRREYGAAKLRYPMFENEGADEFDKFDLRNSSNYAWWRESPTGTNDTFVREVWCRETLGAMGQPYRRSRYYHLYLNGQYWGISETDERPEAAYGATYFGGSETNYDVVKCGNRGTDPDFITEATDGNLIAWSNLWFMTRVVWTNANNSNYFRVIGQNPDGTRNPALPVMMDVDNLIDYMTEIFFSGDGDATLSSFLGNNMPNNWFGMRDRTNPDVGFRFFNSDCEHTMGANSAQLDRTGPFPNSNEGNFAFSNPQWMHEALMRNLEYRVRFGDHVQKHFFNGGALTYEQCTNRWWRKANQITKAIRSYSARWGDVVRAAPYGEADWTNTLRWVANTWLPPRGNIVLAQLTNDLLFPTITAPQFTSYGGFVAPGFSFAMSQGNPGGTIYYTLDGTDPRLIGGATSGTAQTFVAPITVDGNLSVRARVKVGTNWSAVVEAAFTTARYFRDLAITEIMYNPIGTTNVDGDEFEFLELKNTGTNELNLSALALGGGVNFSFTNGTRLGPGAFFVLARNKAQFQARYPGVPVNGVYSGRLNNAGESVSLDHRIGGPLFAVAYGDSPEWPQAADGLGHSLVPVETTAILNSDQPRHWRASTASGGSPGADDPAPVLPGIVINEVLTHTSNSVDFIELFNPGAGAVNVGGWFLTDDASVPKKFRIPNDTRIQGSGYLVFTESDFNSTPGLGSSFTLSAEGEQVLLFSGDAATNLTGYSHGFAFGAAAEGVAFGRHVISTGESQFPAQSASSASGANASPLIADVVLSEIHYNPPPGDDAFVEIRNRSGAPVPLYDVERPTNTWRVNGVGFVFPPGVTLPVGGALLVVETEPAAFRAKYGVPAEVPVLGPYAGTLQDSGELIELQRLDARGTNNLAWVTLDAVRYNDRSPWPLSADGLGASLQRRNLSDYGNEPANWLAALPTPGGALAGGDAPAITAQPANQFAFQAASVTFSVAASGTGPLAFQWRFNGASIPDATNSMLTLNDVQATNGGFYSVLVFNGAGSAESTNALLTVGLPLAFFSHPQSVSLRGSTNAADYGNTTNLSATFTAFASGTGAIRYQWRRNGVEIPGATNTSHTVTNVQLADDGFYDVVATDDTGSLASQPARLSVLLMPFFLQPPISQTVPVGAPVSVSVAISGNPPPFGYQWRSNLSAASATTFVMNERTNYFTFNAHTNIATVSWRLVVTNAAFPTPGINSTFTITTVADHDRDGLPDSLEVTLGLNTNDMADAALDLDGDTMNNLAEYQAGTDPTNAASYLKIEHSIVPGTASLSFGAVSNRTYSIVYSDTLPAAAWTRLADFIAVRSNRVETATDPAWTPSRVYRVATPRQP